MTTETLIEEKQVPGADFESFRSNFDDDNSRKRKELEQQAILTSHPLTNTEWQQIFKAEADGIPKIIQGSRLGECYFASCQAAAQEADHYESLMRKIIRRSDSPKGWVIHFLGSDPALKERSYIFVSEQDLIEPRSITDKEGKLTQIGRIESRNKIDQIMEHAYGRYLARDPEGDANDTFMAIGGGGFGHHYLKDLFGPYYHHENQKQVLIAEEMEEEAMRTVMYGHNENTFLEKPNAKIWRSIFEVLKEKLNSPGEMIIAAGTPKNGRFNPGDRREFDPGRAYIFTIEDINQQEGWGKKRIIEEGVQKLKKKYMDEECRFAAKHAYTLRVEKVNERMLDEALSKIEAGYDPSDINELEESAKIIIVNPWDTSVKYKINFREFLQYFRMVNPVRILEQAEDPKRKRTQIKLSSMNQQREITEDMLPININCGSQVLVLDRKSSGEDSEAWTISWHEDGKKITKTIPKNTSTFIGRIKYNALKGSNIITFNDGQLSREHLYIHAGQRGLSIENVSKKGTELEFYSSGDYEELIRELRKREAEFEHRKGSTRAQVKNVIAPEISDERKEEVIQYTTLLLKKHGVSQLKSDEQRVIESPVLSKADIVSSLKQSSADMLILDSEDKQIIIKTNDGHYFSISSNQGIPIYEEVDEEYISEHLVLKSSLDKQAIDKEIDILLAQSGKRPIETTKVSVRKATFSSEDLKKNGLWPQMESKGNLDKIASMIVLKTSDGVRLIAQRNGGVGYVLYTY